MPALLPPTFCLGPAPGLLPEALMPLLPIAVNSEVEAFLAQNPVEPHAAARLRSLPSELQRRVLERGSLFGARDPSAVLISRVRDATAGGAYSLGMMGLPMKPAMPPAMPMGAAHPGLEMLIARYNLDIRCAQMLRSLPPDKQAVAAELPVHEARNPSAFVMAQLQLPHFALRAAAGAGGFAASGMALAAQAPTQFQQL